MKQHKIPVPRVSPWLDIPARYLIAPLLCRLYRVRGENRQIFRDQKGPYVIVANHTTFFDPVMIAGILKAPIQYIVTDSLLQGILGKVIGRTGVIPLTKGKPDSLYLRQLFAVRDEGKIIGLFPEAQTTWDGSTKEIYKTAIKVIKKLEIPIYGAKVEGGYLKEPKWSASPRKGEIVIRFEKLADLPELKQMEAGELTKKISRFLENDDPGDRKRENRPFHTNRGAEYLERFLFNCLQCGSMKSSLTSMGNTLTCRSCGARWEYSPFGELIDLSSRESVELTTWNEHQTGRLQQALENSSHDELFPRDRVKLRAGYRRKKRNKLGEGWLSAGREGFIFHGRNTIRFPYDQISGCAMVTADYLEFYFEETLYDFSFFSKRANGLKYLRIMQILNPWGSELN